MVSIEKLRDDFVRCGPSFVAMGTLLLKCFGVMSDNIGTPNMCLLCVVCARHTYFRKPRLLQSCIRYRLFG